MKVQNVVLQDYAIKRLTPFGNNKIQFGINPQLPTSDTFERSARKKQKYAGGNLYDGYHPETGVNAKSCVAQQNKTFTIVRESDKNSILVELDASSGSKKMNTVFYISSKNKSTSFCEYTIVNENKTRHILLEWNCQGENYKFNGYEEDIELMENALTNLRTVINSEKYERDFGHNRNLNSQITKAISYMSNLKK